MSLLQFPEERRIAGGSGSVQAFAAHLAQYAETILVSTAF